MSTRTARGAATAVLVAALALTALPATASATPAPDAARAKARSHLKVAALNYDPIGSQGVGFTEYELVVVLLRHGKPYASKRVCDKIRIPKRHAFLRGPCRRTDANGQASFPVGGNRKSTYYVFFKGDRKTKATTRTVVIHGHPVPRG